MVLIVIPGPSVLFSVGRALALGRVGGVVSVVGNTLGLIPIIVLVALGVGSLIVASEPVFFGLRIVGAAYLVYLGVQSIRERRAAAAALTADVARTSHWRQLGQGFVVGVTNPKTIAFFLAVLPQFVAPGAGSPTWQLVQLGLIFAVLALASDSVWAIAAGSARRWFARTPRRIEHLTAIGGACIVVLGLVLGVSAFVE
nr:LysE family translocator [Agromyces seonyuensis]